jgi:ribose/xylose/arabinose/galactoside ABC-type transport system permease subunit
LGLPVGVAVSGTLMGGAILGLLGGLLVARVRVPAIITTLGLFTIWKGVGELLLAGKWITDLPPDLRWWGTGVVAGVPVPILVAAMVFCIAAIFALRTVPGRRIFAAGSNPAAAPLAGLDPARLRLLTFTILGFLVGVAALVSVPRLAVVDSGIGNGFELLVITSVVLGGTSIRGGRGSLWGTLVGVLLLASLRPLLIYLDLGDSAIYWERAIQGGLIVLAIGLDALSRRGEAHR